MSNKRSPDDSQVPLLQKTTSTEKVRPSRITCKSHFLEYLTEFSSPSKYITKYSALAYIAFADLWHYIRKINNSKEPLTMQEMPLPHDYFNVESKVVQLDQKWLEEKNRGSPNFARAAYKSFKSEFLKSGLIMFLIFNGRLVTTIVLGQIIYVITKGSIENDVDKDALIERGIYFAILFLITNITNTHYWNYTFLFGSRMRLAIVGFIYKKLQSTSLSSLQEMNIGKVINLLASDLNDLDYGFSFAWPFLLTPITLTLSASIIWEHFGFFTLLSILWLLISLLVSNKISELGAKPRIEKNAITDSRIKLSNELIECIRLIKMYAWDKPFRKAIQDTRIREFNSYLTMFRLQGLGRAVTEVSVYIASYFMFSCYVFSDGILTPEKIFATIMILTFVRLWCIAFPYMGRTFMVNARVTQKRIEELLNIPDVISVDEAVTTNEIRRSENNAYEMVATSKQDRTITPVQFKNYIAYWNSASNKPCLEDINLTFKPGQVTAIIGKIGSGKTTLLLSFLREIPRVQGDLFFKGNIAYVEQEPIIFSGTVRDNITFGLPFDESLYQKVVRACNLSSDFTQFTDGDMTLVGEKGVTMSGGQKARVSLARALYSRSDIYLLDDPLSAVDSKVARHLFNYAIRGDMLRDKVVILVTHHISFAKEADRIVVLDEGRVIAEGSYDHLITQELDMLSLFNKEQKIVEEPEPALLKRKSTVRRSTYREDGSIVEEEFEIEAEPEKKEFKEEESAVTFNTYKNYLKASGRWWLFISMISSFFIYQICLIMYSRFMGEWGQRHQEYYLEHGTTEGFEHSSYILGGVTLIVTLFISTYLKVYLCARFAADCNNNIHNQMLIKITRAFAAFFDKTPIGTILNRFSNDLGLLDKTNWETFHNVFYGGCILFFSIGTICYINPYVFIPSAVVFLGLIKIRNFFARASIETKRLDLMSRSPLYSEISATVNGLLIIRVFRQGGRFIRTFMDVLYTNSRCMLFMQRTQGVFGLVIDLWLYLLTVSGVFLYIYLATTNSIDPALFGLAMVLMLDLCNSSSWVVKQTLQLDVNMQSAERVLKYCKLPEEAPENTEKDKELDRKLQGKWPSRGDVVFKNVYMKYGQDLNIYALSGLNFEIKAGSKIGVVGRTGAGKSSIIQALFRMVEIESNPRGEMLIDGVNIGELGLDYLRSNLSLIPQNAVIFSGTIKRNLDPFNQYSERELWDLLGEVKLRSYVESLEKKLDTDMTVSSTVFSAGQKQLICLARAILRKSKIIMLDEATANVDIETDNFIQEKINERFKDCTVITIAHRLTTIAHYDKILVLEKGRVVEYDSPYLLMVQNEGDKKLTRTEGWFGKMVLNTGETMAKRIFEISYHQYHNDKK